jgi:predicted component of type VI protein secretion system
MNVSLVVVSQDLREAEVALKKPVQVIGRQSDCQIRIPSSSVSRHHCEISVGDGKVMLRDLGSSNGTYVNQKKIAQAELKAGDLIAVGEFVVVVKIDGKPSFLDPEEAIEDGLVLPSASAPASTPPAPRGAPAQKPMPKPAAKPAAKKGLDDSSVADFDFLNEDDDMKSQPKL